ncbi:MAG: CHASE2 domain-containing protein [Nitrospinaceae bacterium]
MVKKYAHATIGFLVTVIVLTTYWVHPPLFDRIELMFQTAHFLWRGPLPPGPEVVIAGVDEKSLDEMGRWPWPRSTMARLVEKLRKYQVKVIGFDMVFSSRDESWGIKSPQALQKIIGEVLSQGPPTERALNQYLLRWDHDKQFAAQLGQFRKSVLGYFFHFSTEEVGHLTEEELNANFQNIQASRFSGFIKSNAGIDLSSMKFPQAYAVESNLAMLSRKVKTAGFFNFSIEPDGSVRKLPLIVRYRDKSTGRDYYFPPLAVRILEAYLEGSLLFRVNELGVEKVILDSLDPIVIPASPRGELYVNYLGARKTFPHISLADILRGRNEKLLKENLRDKIVIVGATAAALADFKVTPFDNVLPGVEIHATVIDNILRKNFIHQPNWIPAVEGAWLALLGMGLLLLYCRLKPIFGGFIWLFVFAGLFMVHHWVFVKMNYWITDVYPVMENFFIFFALMIYRYFTEEKQKRFIKNAFGQYLSPKVIDQLMENPGMLKLGGEKKVLTGYFTDLEKFTTISENLSAEELVNLLNSYFSEMMQILIKHEGTLDKFDGDAIRAFFGAPIYFQDHAKRACWVCIEMQQRLSQLREQWKGEGKPCFFMRVGINTGPMVVGNMGSKYRMNYGMNGDSVNLAARLEGVNKFYGTYSIISESTYQQAKDSIEVRELDLIRVVGKQKPVKIYELLGKAGETDGIFREILPIYYQGILFYKTRQWDKAIASFEEVLQRRADDGPSHTFLNRCIDYKARSPGKEWDGVYDILSK